MKRTVKELEKSEPKDVEIKLLGDVVYYDTGQSLYGVRIKGKDMPHYAIAMVQRLLEAVTGVVYKFNGKERLIGHPVGLRNYLIEILEKKFGLRVKVCINCKHCDVIFPEKELRPLTRCGHPQSKHGECICTESNEYWAPEEIPEEKKEGEKRKKFMAGVENNIRQRPEGERVDMGLLDCDRQYLKLNLEEKK